MTRHPREKRATQPSARRPQSALAGIVFALVAAGLGVVWLTRGGATSPDALQTKPTVFVNVGEPPGESAPASMVWIPGGQFWMGGEKSYPDAQPVHQVYVDGFWMDRTEVTNARFAEFVQATGYVTVAERTPRAEDFPGADPAKLVAGSIVFRPSPETTSLDNPYAWWNYVAGADWRHPDGPQSSIDGRMDHPVVQVCWDDAAAYAEWAGKRLPTEAEWEFAARGGLDRKVYAWGDELLADDRWQANIWQGRFPNENTSADGFDTTAPVGSFPPNGFGLYDMAGNVWEWCADWYRPDYYERSPRRNPRGPESSFDPNEPSLPKRVQRGGSYLCSDRYCVRYKPGARGKGAPDSGEPHVGFRCVRDAKAAEPEKQPTTHERHADDATP